METNYIINIGDFTADGVTYSDRCLSAAFGGSGVPSEVIPWEGTVYQPWDYKALSETVEETATDEKGNESTVSVVRYTGEFALEPIEIAPIESAPTPQEDTDAMLVDHELRISLLELFGGMNDAF